MSAAISHPVQIGPVTYTLTFNFSTIRYFEEIIGGKFDRAFPFLSGDLSDEARKQLADDVPWGTWGALFWASLKTKHQMTREGSEVLIGEVGFEKVVEWMMRGLMAHLGSRPELMDADLGELAAAAETPDVPPATTTKKAK